MFGSILSKMSLRFPSRSDTKPSERQDPRWDRIPASFYRGLTVEALRSLAHAQMDLELIPFMRRLFDAELADAASIRGLPPEHPDVRPALLMPFVLGAGLLAAGQLDVLDAVLDGIDIINPSEGSIRDLRWVVRSLLPLPPEIANSAGTAAVRAWLGDNRGRLVWDEREERYKLSGGAP